MKIDICIGENNEGDNGEIIFDCLIDKKILEEVEVDFRENRNIGMEKNNNYNDGSVTQFNENIFKKYCKIISYEDEFFNCLTNFKKTIFLIKEEILEYNKERKQRFLEKRGIVFRKDKNITIEKILVLSELKKFNLEKHA